VKHRYKLFQHRIYVFIAYGIPAFGGRPLLDIENIKITKLYKSTKEQKKEKENVVILHDSRIGIRVVNKICKTI
jgi:hypothetical protein